jgi:branched-chain amino acid transport system substrate-binding protein
MDANLESSLRLSTALLCTLFFASAAHAEILIGIAGPLSGPNAAFGNELRVGATTAIAAINSTGGINGENLTLVEEDDNCDSKRAIDVAKIFVSKDVRLIIGHFCSSASLTAAPTYAKAGILMINPSATAPDLTSKNLWNVFRLTGRDDMQADIAAARMKASGEASEVVLLTDQQVETSPLAKRFLIAMPNAKTINVKAGSANLPDDAALLTASSAYLALQATDAGNIASDLKKLNPAITLYGPDLLQSDAYNSKAGDAANGTHISFLQDLTTIADPRRLASLPSSDGATLASYAAVEAFAAAAKARNVNDSRAMAAWLSSGSDIPTIIGTIHFNASGDLQLQPYIWLQWQGGALVSDKKP